MLTKLRLNLKMDVVFCASTSLAKHCKVPAAILFPSGLDICEEHCHPLLTSLCQHTAALLILLCQKWKHFNHVFMRAKRVMTFSSDSLNCVKFLWDYPTQPLCFFLCPFSVLVKNSSQGFVNCLFLCIKIFAIFWLCCAKKTILWEIYG